MRNKLIYFSLVIGLLSACNNIPDNPKNGDVVLIGSDTFDVHVDTHIIVRSVRLHPANIMEEADPYWMNTTDRGETFRSKNERLIGSYQVYQTYKKRK